MIKDSPTGDQSIYWHGLTENQLAKYLQNQGQTNYCSQYALATAFDMLTKDTPKGGDIIDTIKEKGRSWKYAIGGINANLGSFIFQTANLARDLAKQKSQNIKVQLKKGNTADLIDLLNKADTVVLLTITYFKGNEPCIAFHQNIKSSLGRTKSILGGHIMILAAYDPNHIDKNGNPTPWGFLSSWNENAKHIYWMSESDFMKSWGALSTWNMVVLSKTLDHRKITSI